MQRTLMQGEVKRCDKHQDRDWRPALALLGVVGGEVAAAALLAALRSSVPGPADLLDAPVEPAIHGAVWILAAALVGWLMLTTLAAVGVRVLRVRVALPAVDWLTLPPIRRLAERATALSLVATSIAGPATAMASEPPPIPVVVVAETAATAVDAPATSLLPRPSPVDAAEVPIIGGAFVAPTATVDGGFPSTFGAPVPAIDQAAETDRQLHRYVVAPGDNMWTITAHHLAEQLGAKPSNRQVSEVWRVVMDLNRDLIRSGDVDLIFPGEELLLPDVSA